MESAFEIHSALSRVAKAICSINCDHRCGFGTPDSSPTSDLSVHGCFVTTPTPSNLGAKVRVTIVHAGAKIVALGHVVSAHEEGMGIAFTSIEPGDQAILALWMSNLRVE